MKKVLQLSALLFVIALLVAAAPVVVPSAHANAAVLSAQTAQPATYALAQDPQQNRPAAQPQDQNPPNNQNPANDQNPNTMGTTRAHGRRLPKTASPLPELILIGFFSLLGIVVIRRIARNLA